MAITFNFLQWRTGKGMTQQQAADAIGISRREWQYVETGEKKIRLIYRLAMIGWEVENRRKKRKKITQT